MSERRILLAEDDENLGLLLSTYLKSKKFEVVLARDGNEAFEKFGKGGVDFCVLDVMMPKMDGFSLAKEIRKTDKQVPILFLTAKGLKEDKLEGFSHGADDYLTKPFAMEELLARMEAIFRRVNQNTESKSVHRQVGIFDFNADTRELKGPNAAVKLTTKENQLLDILSKNLNETVDRQAALKLIWGDDNYFNGRSMDVYIAKLRKHLKEDPNLEIINVHGIGFRLILKD